MMGYWGDWMMTAWLLWGGLGLLVVAGLAVGVTLLATSLTRRADRPGRAVTQGDAVDVLRMRLARGEIDDEEYERRLATLNGRETPGRFG